MWTLCGVLQFWWEHVIFVNFRWASITRQLTTIFVTNYLLKLYNSNVFITILHWIALICFVFFLLRSFSCFPLFFVFCFKHFLYWAFFWLVGCHHRDYYKFCSTNYVEIILYKNSDELQKWKLFETNVHRFVLSFIFNFGILSRICSNNLFQICEFHKSTIH